mgnify:CR=1 FL=1
MPKVNIYERTNGGVNVETGERLPDPQPRRVSIGWSKVYGSAQLGVAWVDPAKKPEQMPPHAHSHAIDGDMQSAEIDDAGKVWLSQWIDLDRQTINQLIRELRTARDAAFGRDE